MKNDELSMLRNYNESEKKKRNKIKDILKGFSIEKAKKDKIDCIEALKSIYEIIYGTPAPEK